LSPDETNENKTIRENDTTKMFFIVQRFFSPAKTKVRAKLFLFLCVGCEGSVIGVGALLPLPERLKN
jgi:hypothetical protein